MSQIYGSANSALTLSIRGSILHMDASPTFEILLMTDIALKVEQVFSMNGANNYIISLPTGYVRNLCHWFCNHTRERADSLDVHRDIPVDLANSRTCGTHNSVLAELSCCTHRTVAKIGMHIVRQTTWHHFWKLYVKFSCMHEQGLRFSPTQIIMTAWVRGYIVFCWKWSRVNSVWVYS